MRGWGLVLGGVLGTLTAVNASWGWGAAYRIAYGSVGLLGLVIAGTFGWLWWRRTTPLALGMALSWAGASMLVGWWWFYELAGRPAAMDEGAAIFGFLALYLTGALVHLRLVAGAMGRPGALFWGALALVGAGVAAGLVAGA